MYKEAGADRKIFLYRPPWRCWLLLSYTQLH